MTVRPHPARLLKTATAGQFDYPVSEVGKTSDGLVTVYVDTSLPANAKLVAAALLGEAPNLVKQCEAWFGIPCQPVNLIVASLSGSNDGTGGAYHYGCSFSDGGDLYVDYAVQHDGVTMDAGLFIAELSEAFMGAQAKGWNCGGSGGEALSRLCAELVSGGPGGALGAFASAPSWEQAGKPNWIDSDQGSDQDYPSIGCGLVYLSWMMAQGYSAAQITQAGEPQGTLASNYAAVTGETASSAWPKLIAGVNALGKPIANDDPFGGIAANPQPAPTPTPPAPQPPTPQPPAPTPQPPVPSPAVTKAQVIAALTALVNASTLPD